MRRSCSCVLVVAAMALFGCLALSGLEEPTESNSILRRFPGYHVLTLRELDSETRAFFVKQFPRNSPSAVHADFDGDGYLDYAVLVRNNKSGTTKLVILLCSGNGPCKTVYELDVSTHSGSVYIRPVPVGSRVFQTDAISTSDHTSPGRVHSTRIGLTYFEQAEAVLYWNPKLQRIEEVQTGD